MVDRARVWQFEESMGFIHLLQVCLQGSSRYNAPKHDKSGFGKAILSAASLSEDSVDSRMVVDLGIPSSLADPRRNHDRKQHLLDRRRAISPDRHRLEVQEDLCRSCQRSRVTLGRKR